MKASFLASARRLSVGCLFTLCGAVLVSTMTFIAPARSGVVTLDIQGLGSGSLAGTDFGPTAFHFHLSGPDGSNNGIVLSTAYVTIGGGPETDFAPNTTQVGLVPGSNYAFFGLTSGPTDLIHLFFSDADIQILQNSNSFAAQTTDTTVFPAFTDINTSLGLLTFTSLYPNVFLAGSSTTVDQVSSQLAETPLPAALPLFVTGLGALGLLGRRRKRKAAAIAA